MMDRISKLLDVASNFFAHRKGLLPLLGVALIIFNWLLATILPGEWFIIKSNLFLHLGLVVALLGFMLANAL
jgi:membrane-bound ClpP family serine protease